MEQVLNELFRIYGIQIREAFSRNEEECKGTVEQIDGVIELDGEIYLVEMKWKEVPVDVNDVSRHLVRIYHRGYTRAIFISAGKYSDAAVKTCKEALQKTVIVLSTLEEIVKVLEQKQHIAKFLKEKIHIAILDKEPLAFID